MSIEVVDPDTSAAVAQAALEQTLVSAGQAASSAMAAASSAAAAGDAQAAITALLAAMGLPVRWTGTSLQVRLPDGTYTPAVDLEGPEGPAGPAPTFAIGTVTAGTPPSVTLSADQTTPNRYILDLVLPPGEKGDPGPASTVPGPPGPAPNLAIGTVATGAAGSSVVATITGANPNFVLNLTVPKGDPGSAGTGSGTVTHTGTPTSGNVAVFGIDGDHIADGGTLGTAAFKAVAFFLQAANNLSDLPSAATARTNLGLGSLATQSANAVAVTGGHVDGTPIGSTTPAAGAFTTVSTTTPIPVSSGGLGTGTAGGGALDNVLGIPGASGGGLLVRTAAAVYSFVAQTYYAVATRKIATTGALTGGGDLSADRTLDVASNGVDNTRLAQMAAGTVKANTGGASANAADVTPSALLDAAFGATQGDILIRGASGWTALGPGAAGQVLQSGGAGANPAWVAASGAGTSDIQLFGDGSDGNVTISSGTVTLTRDMYYNNLTISGTGQLNVAGFNVFVLGTLDLSAAPANAITCATTAGTGTTGGTNPAGTAQASAPGTQGGTGAASSVGGAGGAMAQTYLGGLGGAGGKGGTGNGLSGGNGGTVTGAAPVVIRNISPTMLYGAVLPGGGSGGSGGGAGGAASTTAGANGSGGGAGGGVIAICYRFLTGAQATNMLSAPGGNGGAGSTSSVYSNGTGGTGGNGGLVMIGNVATGGTTSATGSAGTAGSGTTAGSGGTLQVSL